MPFRPVCSSSFMKTSTPAPRFPRVRSFLTAASFLLLAASADVHALSAAPLSAKAQARAETQIAAVIKDKEARTPAQKKLDSHLIYAAREAADGQAFKALPQFRSNVKLGGKGRVVVEIKGTITPELLEAIAAQGGKVVESYPASGLVRVKMPVLNLEGLAARPEVQFIGLPPKRVVHAGSVTPTADATMLAAAARQIYGADGTGVSVGVMSDSADNKNGALAASYASGDLDPNNTVILPGQSGGMASGEGGAMMELVHDLAPGAKIYFATAFGDFAGNIGRLQAAGCRIIVDDVTVGNESPFQDGPIAQAVATFCASGGLYFSAVGNGGNKEQNTATAWEGDFKDGGDATALGPFTAGYRYHAFTKPDGTTVNGDQYLADGASCTFFWSDPLGASSNDYDVYEVNPAGAVVNMGTNTQDGTQDPYETFGGAHQGDSIVIVKAGPAAARFLHIETGEASPLAISTNGNLRGHNGPTTTLGFFGIAATPCAATDNGSPFGPYPNPFNSSNLTDTFSSDGPRRMFYKPDGSLFTPGNLLSTGGQVFAHPDLTAGDGVNTSNPSFAPFFGTSAAAPDAAAVAALLLSKFPNIPQAQADAALRTGLVPINETPATAGAGILLATNTLAAAAALPPPVVTSFTASGPVGSTVTLNGNNFLGMNKVTFFRNVAAPTFTVVSNTQMTVVVPAGAKTGAITLTTEGSNTTNTKFTVTP